MTLPRLPRSMKMDRKERTMFMDHDSERIWDKLKRVDRHENDPDIRLDYYDCVIMRDQYGKSVGCYSWRIVDGMAVGNLNGIPPKME